MKKLEKNDEKNIEKYNVLKDIEEWEQKNGKGKFSYNYNIIEYMKCSITKNNQ